jgi:NAD(P)-dependent dehydrogenase (short-subunit alcohol dehydrogenase family)
VKAVILTGVSRGLGAALAHALVERDVDVLGVGRAGAPGLESARFTLARADLADVAGLDAALAPAFEALAARKPLSVTLVNNAATTEPMGLMRLHDSASAGRSLDVNLAAPAALCALFLRTFADPAVERRIVNVSSGAARSAIAGVGLYCAAKAGLEMLTRVIATEVGDARFAAISLRPGVIDTDMQTRMRTKTEVEVPAIAMFRAFHADRRLVAPEAAAAKIADKVLLAKKLRNGATYAWPDLDKPLAES